MFLILPTGFARYRACQVVKNAQAMNRIMAVFRIRIQIGSGFNQVSWSGSWFGIRIWIPNPGGRTPKNKMFWSAGSSLLRAEGFSCSLDVLYGGLGISKLKFLIQKFSYFFSTVNFFSSIFGHQIVDPDIKPNVLVADPESMNPNPKHCTL